MNTPLFTAEEWLRYSRHIQLPNFGSQGQTKLKHSHVVIIGMGGLGAPLSLYLAAAGVGQLTLFDGDTVDLTNLQRQIIYTEKDVGEYKVLAAKARLNALNSSIKIHTHTHFFSESTLDEISDDISMIVDCTDNFTARYQINDYCLQKKIPWLYASIHQFSGQSALFTPDNACFRCLFPEAPDDAPDCNTAGVLGVLPGLLGLIQANEVLKFLADLPTPLENHLLLFDALSLKIQKIHLTEDKHCLCQTRDFSHVKTVSAAACASDDTAPEIMDSALTVPLFNEQRDSKNTLVIDVRTEHERKGFHIGGEHIPLLELVEEYENNKSKIAEADTIICYCQSGKRSEDAVVFLRRHGIDAYHLSGGLMAWLKASVKTQ